MDKLIPFEFEVENFQLKGEDKGAAISLKQVGSVAHFCDIEWKGGVMVLIPTIDGKIMINVTKELINDLPKVGKRVTLYAEFQDNAVQSLYYTCEFCGESARKEKWGPGRVTCPSCKRIAKSPSGFTCTSDLLVGKCPAPNVTLK